MLMKRVNTVEEAKALLRGNDLPFRMPTGTGYNTLTRHVEAPVCCGTKAKSVHKGVFEPFVHKERFYIIGFVCPVCSTQIPFDDRQID